MQVTLATHDQQPLIADLIEHYAHELSPLFNLQAGADGRYGYHALPSYWQQASRFPYLIKVDGEVAGFALVTRGSRISQDNEVHDMTEFFVLQQYRRRGVGARAAHAIWRRHPGRWEVRVLATNTPALRFWQAAIDGFTGGSTQPVRVEQAGKHWLVHAFDSAMNRV